MNRSPVVSIHTPCERDVSWLPEAFSLSPSGRMLIRLRSQTVVPNGWTRYQPAPGSEHLRIGTNDPNIVSESNPTRLKEYSLVELGTGRDKTLITAPQGLSLGYTGESEAIWSRDEQSVLLTNTFLPIGDGAERSLEIDCSPAQLRAFNFISTLCNVSFRSLILATTRQMALLPEASRSVRMTTLLFSV